MVVNAMDVVLWHYSREGSLGVATRPLTRQIAALSQRRSLLQSNGNSNGNANGNGNFFSVRSAHAQSASLPPREPLTHFLGACQNLCWRVLRGLSVGVGGARTNTAGRQCRQCVLSCASAYSRVRRGARQRETDDVILREI